MGKYEIDEFAKVFNTANSTNNEYQRLVLNEMAEANRLKRIDLLLKQLELQHLRGQAINYQQIMDEEPEEDQFDCSLRDLAAD